MPSPRILIAIGFALCLILVALLFQPAGQAPAGRQGPEADPPGQRSREVSRRSAPGGHRPSGGAPGAPDEPAPAVEIPLPGRLETVFGETAGLGSRDRVEWLRENGRDLDEEEMEGLLALVESGTIPAGLDEREWHWIVDRIFTELRNAARDPELLTARLDGIFSNQRLDPVVRDYALQHLGHLGTQGGDAAIIRAAAMAGLAEVDSTIAGTALLLLHREPPIPADAVPQGGGIDPGMLALQIIGNQHASVASRVTAIQIAARRGADGTLPAAAAILQSEDAPVLLRVAAVAAIAETGSQADLPILEELSTDSPALLRAASAGIRKLAAAR